MFSPIEFRQLIQTQLRGGVLVDCTKQAGLENETVGNYLIDQLKLKPAVVLDCEDFPATCQIVQGVPSFPLQIYAGMNTKLSVLVSDFVIPVTHEKQLARGLIGWSKKQLLALIISISLANQEKKSMANQSIGEDISAAFSTDGAKHRIAQSRTDLIQNAMIKGMPAALLTEGNWNNFDVIDLQITASASAKEIVEKTIQALDVVLPEVKFEVESELITEKLELELGDGSNRGEE